MALLKNDGKRGGAVWVEAIETEFILNLNDKGGQIIKRKNLLIFGLCMVLSIALAGGGSR